VWSSENSGALSPSAMWDEMTKFFVRVCMGDSCLYPETTNRSWSYTPSFNQGWKEAWDTLSNKDEPLIPNGIKDTIADSFTFAAYPESMCPYHARYCIPFPGVAFKEMPMDYCMPQLDENAAASLGADVTSALESQGTASLSSISEGGIGEAGGHLISTMDAFCAVAFFGFVIGLSFMVLLRFVVGTVVWASLGVVFFSLLIGGAVIYVRSYQCSGVGLFDTLFQAGVAAASAVGTAVSQAVSGETMSEEMTGDGEDYRGAQTVSKLGYFCQNWINDYTDSNPNDLYQNSAYTSSGLDKNYCRNPGSMGETIFCYTTDTEKRWDGCLPVGVLFDECESGYEVDDETMREFLKIVAYIIWGLAGIWLIAVCFLKKRIALAVGINKVAAQFVSTNPNILLVPVSQMIIGFVWVLVWVYCASFLLSQVPADYTPDVAYATYAEAYGTSDTPGECTGSWPAGIVYKYEGDVDLADDPCSGEYGTLSSNFTSKCWKCAPPRYAFDTRFAGAFFSLLWNNAFIIAVGQLLTAVAVSQWFFTHEEERGRHQVVKQGFKTTFRYHLGTVAFGSFILAVVQFIRYWMKYLEKQAAAQKNRVMVIVFKVVQCLLWCFEKCIKFLNKNAYIQTALMGTNFCTSAKNAFFLIMRNALRFGVVAILGTAMSLIGLTVITCGTVGVGYLILQGLYPDISPVVPMLSYVILGYMSGKLFMTTYGLAVDTSLQCFIATEELGIAAHYVPGPLQAIVDQNSKKKKGKDKEEEQKQQVADLKKVAPLPDEKAAEE